MSTPSARVKAGARFLDKTRPGWALKVRIPRLDLEESDACILGQVYGDYYKAVNTLLDGDEGRAERLGFNAGPLPERYCEFDKLWAFEVGVRQRRSR